MSNNLSHKMINVEIPPPASAWEKIAAELEKLNHPQFIDKVASASIEPPASAWENVARSLDKAAGYKVVRLNTSWVKWTAAAVVIGIIAFSSIFILRPNQEENSVNASLPKKENQPIASADAMKGIPSNGEDIHPSIVLVENSRGIRTAQNFSPPEGAKESVRHALIETAGAEKPISKNAEGEPKISDNVSSTSSHFIPAPEYYFVAAPNGDRVKISSKFSDAVTSLYGGDNVDYLWKSRFDSWKSKLMNNPSFIPAAGNFLDIVELKELLKEQ